jgi:hypothetical protein
MKNLNKIQRFYFDKIKSQKLKSLIEKSYTFLTMEDTEKLDLLISASVCDQDKKAEKQLIEMFEFEQQDIQNSIDELEPMTPEEELEQIEAIEEENKEFEKNIRKFEQAAYKEKEKNQQAEAERAADKLLNQLY